jgi:hypothetical protein
VASGLAAGIPWDIRAAPRSGFDSLAQKPLAAFPSWFMRTTCDRCGKTVMHNESHAVRWRDRTLADVLRRMRHDGGGQGRVELVSGIEVQPHGATHRAAGGLGRTHIWTTTEKAEVLPCGRPG